ncbi:hypothetical protein N177_2094 [Lutibaculum baratangense AMV1]|uniref:Uncharacterized protein n=1 Tax=Lutibaculum baratangense AMV1 TaxID=631454 RepID=V4RF48_9HYPH|nr:hypothetical protein N177_2094 [Lutibaculum baratangense AMV1]
MAPLRHRRSRGRPPPVAPMPEKNGKKKVKKKGGPEEPSLT